MSRPSSSVVTASASLSSVAISSSVGPAMGVAEAPTGATSKAAMAARPANAAPYTRLRGLVTERDAGVGVVNGVDIVTLLRRWEAASDDPVSVTSDVARLPCLFAGRAFRFARCQEQASFVIVAVVFFPVPALTLSTSELPLYAFTVPLLREFAIERTEPPSADTPWLLVQV